MTHGEKQDLYERGIVVLTVLFLYPAPGRASARKCEFSCILSEFRHNRWHEKGELYVRTAENQLEIASSLTDEELRKASDSYAAIIAAGFVSILVSVIVSVGGFLGVLLGVILGVIVLL